MFAFFGALAMVVALVGIYGVTSYAVARRTREIGVRMAIGAEPRSVLRLILGESLNTTLCGIAFGWLLGVGVGQALASLFVDLAPFDGWTFRSCRSASCSPRQAQRGSPPAGRRWSIRDRASERVDTQQVRGFAGSRGSAALQGGRRSAAFAVIGSQVSARPNLRTYTISNFFTASSHVMAAACLAPASPRRIATFPIGDHVAHGQGERVGGGAVTNPLTASRTSSAGPPLSWQVSTGFPQLNASTVTKP